MKIAITQREFNINGISYDCLERGWYYLFHQHELVSIPSIVDPALETYNISDVDMLVISGGNDSRARNETEALCITQAVKMGIPILGVCHGAFVLNYIYNGTNGYIENHHGLTHEVDMEDQTFLVNSYHSLCIKTLGDDLIPMAWTGYNVEAFRHKEYPHWGIVWHPERMEQPVLPSDLKRLIYG